ncbi:hypothetical protein ArsFIN_49890 (plasmid) [Arsenophonus nasoniae]|uniref:Uncharacterized protein n=1 Tax=Arsenophonus nasoniae TaxID=638 RepID=A0A4P7L950_9GAMM|nr:hypothetical protein ArsFIN_49890 [Arsenophonus nasoniae]
MSLEEEYQKLLIKQYYTKPKARAEISALFNLFADCFDTVDAFVMVNKFCRRSKRHFLVHDIFDVALNNQSLNGVDNNCKTEYNFQLHRQQIDDS